MNQKQIRFAEEWLIDMNARQAAIRAGYSSRTAHNTGPRLLREPKVRAHIAKRQEERARRTEVDQDRVVRELAAIAFADIMDYQEVNLADKVTVKPTRQMTKIQRAPIAGYKQSSSNIELRLYDKLKALELLGKHLGAFNGTGSGDGSGVTIVDDL